MSPVLVNPSRFAGGTPPAAYSTTVLADAPSFYWRLGEASGTTASDASGNARDGSYVGSVFTLGAASLLPSDPGDTSVTFSGSAAATIAFASWMNTTSLSFECLVKTTTTTSGVILCRDGTSNRCWQFAMTTAGKTQFTVIAGANPTSISATSVNDGNPHHIAITYDGTTALTYIDGLLDKTSTLSQALPQPAATPLTLANSNRLGNNAPFIGTIDEAAYWAGSVLTSTRVAAHNAAR